MEVGDGVTAGFNCHNKILNSLLLLRMDVVRTSSTLTPLHVSIS